jgi:hypothetical protein
MRETAQLLEKLAVNVNAHSLVNIKQYQWLINMVF